MWREPKSLQSAFHDGSIHLGVSKHISLVSLAGAKGLCSGGFHRARLKGLHLFPANRHVPLDSCCTRETQGKWNLVGAKLPLHLLNTPEGMGNNANNMPLPNRSVLSIKPRQQHPAAVVVQAGKKGVWMGNSWHLVPPLWSHKLLPYKD